MLSYNSRNRRPPRALPRRVRGIIPMSARYEPCLLSPLPDASPMHPSGTLSTILPASRNCILHIRIQQVFRHITRSSRFPLRCTTYTQETPRRLSPSRFGLSLRHLYYSPFISLVACLTAAAAPDHLYCVLLFTHVQRTNPLQTSPGRSSLPPIPRPRNLSL